MIFVTIIVLSIILAIFLKGKGKTIWKNEYTFSDLNYMNNSMKAINKKIGETQDIKEIFNYFNKFKIPTTILYPIHDIINERNVNIHLKQQYSPFVFGLSLLLITINKYNLIENSNYYTQYENFFFVYYLYKKFCDDILDNFLFGLLEKEEIKKQIKDFRINIELLVKKIDEMLSKREIDITNIENKPEYVGRDMYKNNLLYFYKNYVDQFGLENKHPWGLYENKIQII